MSEKIQDLLNEIKKEAEKDAYSKLIRELNSNKFPLLNKASIEVGKQQVRNQLSYRLGFEIVQATKKPLKMFLLPFALYKAYQAYLNNRLEKESLLKENTKSNKEITKYVEKKKEITWVPNEIWTKYKKIISSVKHQSEFLLKKPLVSVAVPVYNNYEYITECINSILQQTLKDLEVIIVDDGSTDERTIRKLDEFASLDSRIVVIHKINSGYGHNMNLAMDIARGKYFGIVESDDYIQKEMYFNLFNIAEKESLDLIKGDFSVFYGEGKDREFVNRDLMANKKYYNKVTSSAKDIKIFNINNVIWNGIYSIDFLRKNNIRFNETPGASFQDNGFWFQTMALANQIMFDAGRYYMLRRDNPNSSVFSKKKVWAMVHEYKFIWNFLERHKELKERLKYIYTQKKFQNYLFNYNRIAGEYKIAFLQYISAEMKKAKEQNLLNKIYFSENSWKELHSIIENFVQYHETKFPYNEKFSGKYSDAVKLDPVYYSQALAQWYKNKTGRSLDLNNPKTYDEKIQWLKIFDSNEIKAILSDKYLVRDWISRKIGSKYLVKLLGVWDKFDEIDFNKLPNRFVLKTNHGSGTLIVVKDKSKFDIQKAKKKFDEWMSKDFGLCNGFELHYCLIDRKIIAEEYIENENNDLHDYKVWCFNGEAKYIQYLSERNTNGLKMNFFDLNWNEVDIRYNYPRSEKVIPRPKQLEKLINLSRILARNFNHVRVDFYILNDGNIKFGEMTFTSSSGDCKWIPEEADITLGNLFDVQSYDDYQFNQLKRKFFYDPEVSIIVPVFNNERYVRNAIKDLCHQTFPNIEILCINDKSTDNSLAILEELALNDTRIKVVTQSERKGAGAARNKGISLAKGKYLLFLDADDRFRPDLVDSALKQIKKEDSDICIYRAQQFFENLNRIEPLDFAFDKAHFPNKSIFSGADFPEYIFNCFQNWTWNKLFKKEFINKNKLKFQEIKKTNDLLFVCSALIKANKITTLDKNLISYRKNTGSSTQDTNYLDPVEFLKAFDALENLVKGNSTYEKYLTSFYNHKIGGCMYNLFSIKKRKAFAILFDELKKRASDDLEVFREKDCYNKTRYKQYVDVSKMDIKEFISKYNVELID